jgi:hypothetical protein
MKRSTRAPSWSGQRVLDRFELYELCAQAPARDARLLLAIHGGAPRVLGEDFSGAGAISREWVGLAAGRRAVAVDHDPEPLRRVRAVPGVKAVCADVLRVKEKADIIAALNFSIGELHSRGGLVAYLRHAGSRLRGGGVLVCDIYGGSDAFMTGRIRECKAGPRGERVVYTWEQRTADPLTGRVVNAMHFRVTARPGGTSREIHDAFVYDWRLWSVPELRDAMLEAGFGAVEVYPRFAEATDADGGLYLSPIEDAAEVGDSFSVYVVGRGKRKAKSEE